MSLIQLFSFSQKCTLSHITKNASYFEKGGVGGGGGGIGPQNQRFWFKRVVVFFRPKSAKRGAFQTETTAISATTTESDNCRSGDSLDAVDGRFRMIWWSLAVVQVVVVTHIGDRHQTINSMWPSDVIWCHEIGSGSLIQPAVQFSPLFFFCFFFFFFLGGGGGLLLLFCCCWVFFVCFFVCFFLFFFGGGCLFSFFVFVFVFKICGIYTIFLGNLENFAILDTPFPTPPPISHNFGWKCRI